MATVGWASLQIIPSMQGVAAEVTRGLGGMREAGQAAGRDMGQGVADGLKRAESVVAKASQAVAKTREAEVAAAAKVRIEEAKLQELRDKGITDGSRFLAAQERLRVATDRGIQATRNARAASEDLTNAQERLRNATRDTANAAEDSGEAFEDAAESGSGAFSSLTGKAKEALTSLQGMALGAVAVGASITAGIADAMNTEVINDKMAASLGASPELAAEYGKIAGDVYRNAYGESLEEVTESVAIVQSSFATLGFEGEASIEKVTSRAMDFAAVFGVDVQDSVQTVSQLMNQGLVKDSTEGFDLLTASFQRVPAAMRDELPEILQEYGVNFNALGFTGEQAFNALVLAAGNGKFALDKTGDALKEFTILGTDMSESSQEAYKAIDLDAKAMADSIIAGGPAAQEALQKTAQGLLAMPDAQERATTAIALFGAPLEDLSVDQIPAFLEGLTGAENAMGGFEGSTDAMGSTLSDNWTTKLEALKRSIKGAFVDALGVAVTFAFDQVGRLTPIFTDISAVFTNDVLPALKSIGGILMEVGQVAIPILVAAVGSMLGVLSNLANAVMGVVNFFTEHKDIAIAVGAVLATLLGPAILSMTATLAAQGIVWAALTARMVVMNATQKIIALGTKAWAAAQWLLNAAMTANPIGLIVAALVALVAGIVLAYRNSETFRNIVQAAWQGIQTAFSYAWESVIKPVFEALKAAFFAVGDAAMGLWNNAIVPAFNGIKSVFDIWWAAVQIYFNAVKAAFQAIGDAAMWLWNNAILPAFNGIKMAIELWWNGVQLYFNFVKDAFTAIANKAVEMKDGIVNAFNFVVEFVRGVGTTIKDAAGNIWGFLIDGLKEAIHAVGRVLKNVNIKIPGWVPGVGGKEFGFKSVGEAMEKLRDGGTVTGRAGRTADGLLWGPGTGTSDSLLGVDATGMPIVRVSKDETVVTADASADPANAAAMAAMNAGWSIGDWVKKLPGHAVGGVVGEPYGLPGGSSISYGGSGFPDWVNQIAAEHNVKPSTYPGHQEGDRNEPGYAPNPSGLNRGIDWSGSIGEMQGFADYLMSIAPNTDAIEQIIWMNPETGQKLGWAGRTPDTSGSYFAADYSGHQDHVHTRQSAAFGGAPVDTGPLEQPGLAPGGPDVPQTPSSPMSPSTTPATPTTPAEPEKAFSGRDRFKKLFTDLGSIAADSLIEVVGVGEWLDLADRYTIKSSDTAATSSSPQASTAAPSTPSMPSTPGPSAPAMELDYPARDPAPTSGPDFYSHEIVRSAKENGLDRLAAVIGNMTALVEVGDPMKMYANNADPETLAFPHDAISSDGSSSGLFQQQNNGAWGTAADRMDPFRSAGMFYDVLRGFDYHAMAPGDAAQKVQRSAFPGKYAEKQGRADELVNNTGLFDAGGWLMPGQFGYNALNEPEPILERSQWDTAEAAINTVKELAMSGGGRGGDTYVTNATFRDERAYYMEKRREARLGMKRYSGGTRVR